MKTSTTKSKGKTRNSKWRRQHLSPFMSKLYRYFDTKLDTPIELKKLRGVQGWYNRKEDTIEVDYRKQFLPTLLHEVIHHYYPHWSETRVLKEESKITNALTIRQVENIFIRYGKYLEEIRKLN